MSCQTEEVKEVKNPPKEKAKEVSISAVGDILIHSRVYNDAKIDEETYDFTPMFQEVKPYLEKADITFANQETMIGGIEHGLSNFPTFNSPKEVGDALKHVGVDIVSLANNHTLDRGEDVIFSAIDHWKTLEMDYVGAYESFEDQSRIRVLERNGIKIAFLAYSYGTNGIDVPKGKAYLVNLIDYAAIEEEVLRAKEVADVIILSSHQGIEYEAYPNQEQKDLMQFAADLGVDVVIGHHPHVLQPIDWIEGKSGNKMLGIYSLGNFLSGQDELDRQIGGIVNFLVKESDGQFMIDEVSFLPTYVEFEPKDIDDIDHQYKNFLIHPFFKVTDEILPNAEEILKEKEALISEWMPDLKIITEEEG